MKTYTEPANTLPVYDKCELLIVGSGAAGHSAAIAAARAGCKNIILMERYGYSGGDVTGGYVLMVPRLSFRGCCFVRGLQEEWFTRLSAIPNAVWGPDPEDAGSSDPAMLEAWGATSAFISKEEPRHIIRAVYFDPTDLKIEMDHMLLEERDRIRVLYHSWGTKPIVEDGKVKGVIFESKEGRQVILAKTVIDATGDGDIFRQSGAPFIGLADASSRSSGTALVWRIGGVKHDQFYEWKKKNPEIFLAMRNYSIGRAGFRCNPEAESRNDIYWVNNWHAGRNCASIQDMTETEMTTRSSIRDILAYYKKVCPVGFRDAYIYDIAPQLGARCSNRLVGEYVLSSEDFTTQRKFDDVIAWHSTVCKLNKNAPIEIPYRAILPQKIDNLLCPGRHLSADGISIDWLNLIPQCIGTGQAAGVAAAVAVKSGSSVRNVDIKEVQNILIDQDVPLPRNSRVDPALTQCCEDGGLG